MFGFVVRLMLALYNELGNVPSSSVFRKSLRRICVSSLNVFKKNSPVKPSGAESFFVGRFLLVIQSRY